MRRSRSLALVLGVSAILAARAAAADPAEGEWLVQDGNARVRIAPCAGRPERLCGAVVWLGQPRDEDGDIRVDDHNPDPAFRNRPLLGLELIRDFRSAGPGRWEGGKIYDPNTGRTYASRMRVLADGALKVDGCVLMFCQGQTWRRVRR